MVGRVLFGGFFFIASFNHFTKTEQMAQYASSHGVTGASGWVVFTGLMLLAGGLSVLLGLAPRIGLAVLVLFLLPVSFIMHNFWAESGEQAMTDMMNFMKNIALAGGALGLMALRVPWAISVDEAIHRKYPEWDRWTGFIPPAAQH
ncbi:MAG: DoxX family protein [Myxococcaceae bacterium]